MHKIKLKLIAIVMKRFGIPSNMSYKFYIRILDDLKYGKEIPWKEKLWSYRRGFLVSSTQAYGLTPQNYKYYLSDVDYYRLYPLDKQFRHWIDDKLTMKYMLSPYSDYLPKYFCALNKGGIIPLVDGKDIRTIESLLECIKREKQVALKLISAAHGIGFYKISFQDDHFEIDNQSVTEEAFIEFLKTREEYLVTEYVMAHDAIRNISCDALNTVRIMVINEDDKHPKIANSVMKFSTKASGQVDNVKAGSVFAKVDVLTGEFSDAKNFVDSFCFSSSSHPDSKLELKGVLPNWQALCAKLIEISQYLAPLTYLGYDIAITNEGFKIIEINSHQGVMLFQCYGPLLKENIAADYFNRLLAYKNGIMQSP